MRRAAGWLWDKLRLVPPGILALGVIIAVCAPLAWRNVALPFSQYDQPFYLGIAYDLRHHGRFTDGYFFAGGGAKTERPLSMRFGPLYPALLAGVAALDDGLAADMDCLVAHAGERAAQDAVCGHRAPVMRGLQFAALCAVYWLIWWLGGEVLGGLSFAWLSLAVALLTAPTLVRSADALMTEMTTLLLTTVASAAAVAGFAPALWPAQRRRRADAVMAALGGAALAAAALTRPGFLYLAEGAMVCAAVTGLAWPSRRRAGFGFVLAGLAVLLPWMLRNVWLLGRFDLSFGYASHTLAQRIAFNSMSARDYALSFVCWLPDGRGMGQVINPPRGCDRFGWEAADGFYQIGQHQMIARTLAEAGGWDHHLSYLLHAYVLPHAGWHLAVSVPLALHGGYVAHWWGVVLLFVTLAASVRAWRGGDWAFVMIALPGWFMLALNAAVAVNQERYNLMLILPYSLAGAAMLARVWRRVRLGGQADQKW